MKGVEKDEAKGHTSETRIDAVSPHGAVAGAECYKTVLCIPS